jgi:hypothetical protein
MCCVGKCGQGPGRGEASVVLCDNKAAVSLCSDHKETKRAKHIEIFFIILLVTRLLAVSLNLCIASLRIMCLIA